MTNDLPGLVRHVGRLFLIGAVVTGLVALVTFIAGRDATDEIEAHWDAVIVLGTLTALQALFWFGLTYWADLVTGKPAQGLGG